MKLKEKFVKVLVYTFGNLGLFLEISSSTTCVPLWNGV